MMPEDFLDLCKSKVRLYLDQGDDYDIFTLWKDYWTIGSTGDNIKVTDIQKAILGTSLENTKYFEFTYVEAESKLYLNVYDIDDTETYTIVPDTTPPTTPGV